MKAEARRADMIIVNVKRLGFEKARRADIMNNYPSDIK